MSISENLHVSMWNAVLGIAQGMPSDAAEHLAKLKGVLNVGPDTSPDAEEGWECVQCPVDFSVNVKRQDGLRPLDVLAAGRDSAEACYAAIYLVQAGADMDDQPNASDGPPSHVAAFNGNWQVLGALIDMGADIHKTVSAARQSLLGGNPIHALASGFRAARGEDYGQCFAALLGAGGDINAKDRKRQVPIDIAMRSAATTNNRSLVEAMLNYGVELTHNAARCNSASSLASAVTRKTGDAMLIAQMSRATMANIANMSKGLRALQAVDDVSNEVAAPHP